MSNDNKEKSSFLKGKGASAAIIVCFTAVIVMVGAFTFNKYQENLEKQMAKAEEEIEQMTKEEAATDNIVLPEVESDISDDEEVPLEEEGSGGEDEEIKESQTKGNASETQNTSSEGTQVWFGEESLLQWPASGAVVMDYSMDKTVYFSTLEQYKYNPALIIGGVVGENIGAAAPGIVTSIEQEAQTGLTVTLDMGNGYSAIYGQLKEVPVAIGQYVAQGQIVGYLSEPSKYYTEEGPNLYFQVTKDGEPVNPIDFMEG